MSGYLRELLCLAHFFDAIGEGPKKSADESILIRKNSNGISV